ncbi:MULTISPECIES: hypothetical protein [unclassified Lacinutrix]
MEKNEIFTPTFFKNLGKLFYAIAASDKKVEVLEIESLKEIIQSQWLPMASLDPVAVQQIESTFNTLQEEDYQNTEALYQDFVTYKKEETHLFTNSIKSLILQTSNAIASSFSGRNKSELIMLAKLEMELKK